MPQSDLYKRSNKVDYLGGLPGARISDDLLVVQVDAGTLDVADRDNRVLGNVDVTSLPEPVRTHVAEALASEGTDHLLVQQNDPLDVSASTVPVQQDNPLDVSASTVPVEEQSPNAIENTGGNQIDPATEQTIQSILDAVATEQTLSSADAYLQSIDNNVAQESTLSALADALESNANDKVVVDHPNRLDVSSRDSRNLGNVDVTAVNDSVQTEDSDFGSWNAATLTGSGTLTLSLSGQGSENILGRVVSDAQYSVELSWKDNNGNEIFRDSVASGVAGGTETSINETAISPNVDVIISDGSGADATANGTVHLT